MKATRSIAPACSRVHRLRVSLEGVYDPAIWRQIEVPSDWPIDFLADAIRCVFGWSWHHACKFTIQRRDYGTHNDWVRDDPEQLYNQKCREIRKLKLAPGPYRKAMLELLEWWDSLESSAKTDDENAIPSVDDLLTRAGAKFKFVFDYGDWWEHTGKVEKIEPLVPGNKYPRCIGGGGANPIEDCGGAHVMGQVIHAIRHPTDPQNATVEHIVKNWLGKDWSPTAFSVEAANERLDKTFCDAPPPSDASVNEDKGGVA